MIPKTQARQPQARLIDASRSDHVHESAGGGGGGTDDQTAAEVSVDATGFAGNLATTDDDVQTALATIDDARGRSSRCIGGIGSAAGQPRAERDPYDYEEL